MHLLKEWKIGDYAKYGDRTGRIEKILKTGQNGLVRLRYQDESRDNVHSSDLVEAQGYVVQAMGSVSKPMCIDISRLGNPPFSSHKCVSCEFLGAIKLMFPIILVHWW